MATKKKSAKKTVRRKTVAKSAARKAPKKTLINWDVFKPELSAVRDALRTANARPSGASKDEVGAAVSQLDALIDRPPGAQNLQDP